ncbi:hypothetical protein ACQY0O_004269 [Thecaphora frezii]
MVKKRHQKTTSSSSEAAEANDDEVAASHQFDDSIRGAVASLEKLGQPLPKLVAFDLDFTLWPLWVDTHVDPPLKRKGNAINKVVDRYGQPLSFFPHVPSILFYLKRHGVEVAAASRTCAPPAARQALNGLVLVDDGHLVPPSSASGSDEEETEDRARSGTKTIASPRRSQVSQQRRLVKSISLFDYLEIYPGSKISHFREIQKDSGVEYEDMVFFDDEHRNAEVSTKLGVHFVEVGHQGTDLATFERGIREWRAKKLSRMEQRGEVGEVPARESGVL